MRVPIIPCPISKNEKKFKKIGDKFMNHPAIKKNINKSDLPAVPARFIVAMGNLFIKLLNNFSY